MKTQTDSTPEAIREQLIAMGFSLESSAPSAGVDEKQWPHIAYTVRLLYRGQEVLSTPYKLGVGHVKPKAYGKLPILHGMTPDEENTSHHWARGMHFNTKDARTAQLWASTAAKLAKTQKVVPTLESVMHSLCLDGEAFFNAQSFEDWAANFGYDSDSRSAEVIFYAYDAIGRKLAHGIPADVLASVREAVSNL